MPRKKTHEEFLEEVKALVGDEYEVIGKYINSKTKIEMKHNECGYKYNVQAGSFLGGTRCPECQHPSGKKTTEKFAKEVLDILGKEYEVLGEYVDKKTKIEILHKKCNSIWRVRPSSVVNGSSCFVCTRQKSYSTDEFKRKIYALTKGDYKLIGEYKNSQTKVEMLHESCGYKYFVNPSSFLSGRRCPRCSGLMKKTTKEYKKEVFNLVGNEYVILGDYINALVKVETLHQSCGSVFPVTPNSFLSGVRCPNCTNNKKKTTQEFKEDIFNLVKNEYSFLGDYEGATIKKEMKHEKCGHIYKVKPNDFLSGYRCPRCRFSKGEKKISEYVESKNIKYISQYKTKECKNIARLPFDFAIFNNNETINCLIEYDGEQHYQSKEFFGGEEAFKQRQHNDQIKNQYCKDNNIKLIRIPYWDFDNIEDILNEELKEVIKQSKSESNV